VARIIIEFLQLPYKAGGTRHTSYACWFNTHSGYTLERLSTGREPGIPGAGNRETNWFKTDPSSAIPVYLVGLVVVVMGSSLILVAKVPHDLVGI
jgi:hypothetical protein